MEAVRSIILSSEVQATTFLKSELARCPTVQVVAEADLATGLPAFSGEDYDAVIVVGSLRGHAVTAIVELKKRYSRLPVVMVGPNSKKSQRMAETLGVDAYIPRARTRARTERLVAALVSLVEGKSWVATTPRPHAGPHLSGREEEAVSLFACGFSHLEVADKMFIKPASVKKIRNRINRRHRHQSVEESRHERLLDVRLKSCSGEGVNLTAQI